MKQKRKLTKKHLAALEKVFTAEIEDRLPFQARAKIYGELVDKEYLFKETINKSGVQVTGYFLSHLGRYSYCNSCDGAWKHEKTRY